MCPIKKKKTLSKNNIMFRNEKIIFELTIQYNADSQATVLLNGETFCSVWRWDDKALPLS